MTRAIAAAVLAGGKSRRFGSDKRVAQLRGAPLVEHVLRGLAALEVEQLLFVAKDAPPFSLDPRVELVLDGHAAETPLAGLAAALRAARCELVFAVAADMPFAADAPLLDALIAALAGHDAAAPLSAGVMQPLCALWRREACLAAALAMLALPAPPGPRALLDRVRTARLDWPDARPFADCDTPEALAALDRR